MSCAVHQKEFFDTDAKLDLMTMKGTVIHFWLDILDRLKSILYQAKQNMGENNYFLTNMVVSM